MRLKTYLTMVCLFLFGMTILQAQTQYVGPDGGDWFTASNWNNGLPANGNDPLIGGGVSVVIGAPLTVDFSITNFGGIVADADVINDGTISNSSTFDVTGTGSLTNNATFNNFSTATFAGPASFVNENGASFTNSGTFTLSTMLVNRGSITNNGTIDAAAGTLVTEGNFNNAQTLTTESLTVQGGSTFTNNFGSNLIITGAAAELVVDGNFNNLGDVNAEGIFTINGNFSNSSSVTAAGILTINVGGVLNNNNGTVTTEMGVQNFGTFINGFQLVNTGSFNNFGQVSNNNLIDNQLGGTFTNRPTGTISMGFGSKLQNAGTFTNENVYDSFGTTENDGTLKNSGTINSFSGSLIDNNANFINDGIIAANDQVLIDGPFTNNGTVNVNGGSTWRNNGNFINSTAGAVIVLQDFINEAGGTLVNNGRWTNFVRTTNEGAFTNNALLEILSETLSNTAGATFVNNELLLLKNGNIRNGGTITNNDKLLSDDCSTINNTGTIDNQSDFELRGIMFQTGTLSGNATDCQGCYVHTSTDSNAPSICQNGTFGADINGEVKVYSSELIAFENFDSCTNIVYLANGEGRPVFSCADIGNILTVDVVLRTRLNDSLTCTAEVTPVDILEPQYGGSCPLDVVIFTPDNSVTVDWVEPTAVDNCTATNLTASHAPGDSFPIGITGVTYSATDDYGNTANCQFRVDVRQTGAGGDCTGDADAPTFADCPDNITLSTTGNSATAGWTPPTPTDNCYPVTLGSNFAPGQNFGLGNTTVIYTATDGNGNEETCEFTVTVNFEDICLVDNVAPSFSNCPANIYRPTNPVTGGAVAVWNEPGVFDICGLSSVTATNASGEVFPEGSHTVTYTAEDNSGNVSTCNFTVTVGVNPCPGDNSPPQFSNCPANISLLTNGSSAVAIWTPPSANSSCNPVTINSNYQPGSTFQLGITPIVYQASDLLGNVSTCSFTVLVENACSVDNVSPVISNCPADITVAATGASGTAIWTAPTATDNCQLTTFVSSFQPGASFPVGVTTVVYTAADLQGNIATCEFNVFVVDGPDCTSNASPIEGATDVDPTSVTLNWNSAANASSYDVYLGTNNPPTAIVAGDVSGTSTTVSGLQEGTTYYWYVVPKNAAGSATGCDNTATSFNTSGTSGDCGRVTDGLIALYEFREGSGNTVKDVSGIGVPVDLTIHNPGNVSWVGSCGLSVNSATIIQSSGAAGKISTAAGLTNELTVEAWVSPANNTQGGPARIATMSSNTTNRNFTLGQEAGSYNARLRTTSGGTDNGIPTVSSNGGLALQLQHVVYTRDAAGNEKIFVDGAEMYSGVRAGHLDNWNHGYQFALANEISLNRPWLGEIYLVAVYDKAFSAGDVLQNLNVGACCTPTDPPGGCEDIVSVSTRINNSTDDAEERLSSGYMKLTSSDLELISDGSNAQIVGMRFTNIEIPQGAVISNAYIEFETDELNSGPTSLTFRGQDIDDAPTFSYNSHNISSRTKTSASVEWNNLAAWNTYSEKHQTPNLSPIVQEIVDRGGWLQGNDLVIMVEGFGERTAESYNGESANAPLLVVEYENCEECDGAITGLVFFNLGGGSHVNLTDGGSYTLGSLPSSYNVQAQVSGTLESVHFDLNGPVSISNTENVIPYHLNGDPNPIGLIPGSYSLTVSVYSEDHMSGILCSETTVNFTIVEDDPCENNTPDASVSAIDGTCGQANGSITFTFPNHPTQTGIEFSIDGGNTYPYWTPDNAGTLIVSDLMSGTYNVWVRWDNSDCPQDLGTITIGDVVAAPNAVCQNLTLQQTSAGQSLQISGADVDGGSTAGCGSISSLNVSPNSFSQTGIYTVTLTVTNSFGLSTDCNATVTVNGSGCNNVTSGGTISKGCQDGQIVLGDVQLPSGGSGAIEYLWIAGTTDCDPVNMTTISGSGSTPEFTMADVSETTFVIRCSRREGCTDWDGESNCITIEPGECAGPEICKGDAGTGLFREVWYGIPSVQISALTNHINYPDNPTFSDVISGSTGPSHIGDNYGTRVRGFITPSQSGDYIFYVTGDDQTELYLSTDDSPANASLISNINGWTHETEYYKFASQKSVSISLTAGQDYYVELLQKEGGGGDHWGIHWTPNNGTPTTIPVSQLTPVIDCNACNNDVLFVVGNTFLNNGDHWVNTRLQNLGYNVEIVNDDYVTTEDADGKGLIVVSSTVISGKVGDKFTHLSIPVVTWEAWLLDNLKMTGTTTGHDYGNTNSQYKLTIDDPSHPLAAGLSGLVHVFTYTNTMNWGWRASGNNALKIARVGHTDDYGILAYDEGDPLFDGSSAPAKRVSLWLNNTSATILNANGVKLFDAAISWASSCGENFGEGLGDRSSTLDLAASKSGLEVELVWLSNTADSDIQFSLERSADGQSWEEIQTFDSKVSDGEFATYRTYDQEPIDGRNYYRVISQRMGASSQISSIAEVLFTDLGDYAIFPNPTTNQVYVDLSTVVGQEVLVRLFDAKGVTVQEWELTATEEPMKLDLTTHQSGQYMFWMYVDDRRPMTKRVILERN